MENLSNTKSAFSIARRVKSFIHAGRGVRLFLATTHNAWIQTAVFAATAALGFSVGITNTEWMLLILSGGFVLAAEAFNTAIEIDMDLTSPTAHPYARDTKDVAAGAVLIAALAALAVGVLIFYPYLSSLLF